MSGVQPIECIDPINVEMLHLVKFQIYIFSH